MSKPENARTAEEMASDFSRGATCEHHYPLGRMAQQNCTKCVAALLKSYASQEVEKQKQREERLMEFVEYIKDAMHLAVSPELRLIAGQVLNGDYSWTEESEDAAAITSDGEKGEG